MAHVSDETEGTDQRPQHARHDIVRVHPGPTDPGVVCECGKAIHGRWDPSTLNAIAAEHLRQPDQSMMQALKTAMTGSREPWSPRDRGYPWKANHQEDE